MQLTANLKNTAPGLEKALPAFSKGSDGTADFGGRYNPITGLTLPATGLGSPNRPSGVSFVPYSENVAQTTWSELSASTRPEGVTTSSYKDWIKQREKHARVSVSPAQRHTMPVTSAMEVGWPRGWALEAPSKGKVKCKETATAEAQILGPRFVDVLSPDTKMHF